MSDENINTRVVSEPLSETAKSLIESVHDTENSKIRVNEDSPMAVWLTIEYHHSASLTELATTAAELGDIDYLNTWRTERHEGFDIDLRVEL